MMRKILIGLYVVISFGLLVYLASDIPRFPQVPENSAVSSEPADVETPLRIAFFTDMSRSEVVEYYLNHYKGIRTILPPEDAVSVIRDQTRSTFLEELVIPMKSSLYINGFEPKNDKDAIVIEGRKWRQKIIVKYVGSNAVVRIALALSFIGVFYIVLFNTLNGMWSTKTGKRL